MTPSSRRPAKSQGPAEEASKDGDPEAPAEEAGGDAESTKVTGQPEAADQPEAEGRKEDPGVPLSSHRPGVLHPQRVWPD